MSAAWVSASGVRAEINMVVTGLLRHSSSRSLMRPTGPTREISSAKESGTAAMASSRLPSKKRSWMRYASYS